MAAAVGCERELPGVRAMGRMGRARGYQQSVLSGCCGSGRADGRGEPRLQFGGRF